MTETAKTTAPAAIVAIIGQSIEFSPSRKNLMLARLKAQSEFMQGAKRDRTNPFAKNTYATLESVLDAVAAPMTMNGLVLTQWAGELSRSEGKDGRAILRVYTRIEHAETSEYMQVCLPITLTKDDAQGIGSAMTYGRRYTLKSALGIPEVDDDGAAASGMESELRPKRKSSAEAKRDGTDKLFKEIKVHIDDASTSDALRDLGSAYSDAIADMPDRWRDMLREEYAARMSALVDAGL